MLYARYELAHREVGLAAPGMDAHDACVGVLVPRFDLEQRLAPLQAAPQVTDPQRLLAQFVEDLPVAGTQLPPGALCPLAVLVP